MAGGGRSAFRREQAAILFLAGSRHGFLVLSDTADFCYKCDDVYHPNDEGGLMWNDPTIGIEWPALDSDGGVVPSKIILSDKDKLHPSLAEV